jgi:hypothetical protein
MLNAFMLSVVMLSVVMLSVAFYLPYLEPLLADTEFKTFNFICNLRMGPISCSVTLQLDGKASQKQTL